MERREVSEEEMKAVLAVTKYVVVSGVDGRVLYQGDEENEALVVFGITVTMASRAANATRISTYAVPDLLDQFGPCIVASVIGEREKPACILFGMTGERWTEVGPPDDGLGPHPEEARPPGVTLQ